MSQTQVWLVQARVCKGGVRVWMSQTRARSNLTRVGPDARQVWGRQTRVGIDAAPQGVTSPRLASNCSVGERPMFEDRHAVCILRILRTSLT